MFRLIRPVAWVARPLTRWLKQVVWHVVLSFMFCWTTLVMVGPPSILLSLKLGQSPPSPVVLVLYWVCIVVVCRRRLVVSCSRLVRRPLVPVCRSRFLTWLTLCVAPMSTFCRVVSALQHLLPPIWLPPMVLTSLLTLSTLTLQVLVSIPFSLPSRGPLWTSRIVTCVVRRTVLLNLLGHRRTVPVKVPWCRLGASRMPLLALSFRLRLPFPLGLVLLRVSCLVLIPVFLPRESLFVGGRRPPLAAIPVVPFGSSCPVSCLRVGCRVGGVIGSSLFLEVRVLLSESLVVVLLLNNRRLTPLVLPVRRPTSCIPLGHRRVSRHSLLTISLNPVRALRSRSVRICRTPLLFGL